MKNVNGITPKNRIIPHTPYDLVFIFSNIFLIYSIIITVIYLGGFLYDGKSVTPIFAYGSWIILALCGRFISQRARNSLEIRVYDYLTICLAVTINFFFWFKFPTNVILTILCVLGSFFSYRARKNKAEGEKGNGGNTDTKHDEHKE